MFHDKVISKVPGQVPKNLKDNPGYLDNFEKLSNVSLTEILERQNKLLEDRVFVRKLPDRGERIRKLKERLEDELKRRNEVSDVCEVMSGLIINGKELSDNLEWRNKDREASPAVEKEEKTENDEDENPLKIIATHSGAGFHQKKIRKEEEPELLIKPSDLAEDKEDDSPAYEPYVEALSSKIDATSPKERYIPFKTLNKKQEWTSGRVRDVSAASPPLLKLANVKEVSLQESLRLQVVQAQHLRQVQLKHAAERLREKGSVVPIVLPPSETTAHYRESPPSDSEEEILDEDAKEESGGVRFPIADS